MNRVTQLFMYTTILFLFIATEAFGQFTCDAQFVSLQTNQNRILIRSQGTDDTDNIQCGLDLAVDKRIAEVYLPDETYNLGSVIATGYRGTIRGKGMTKTRLVALPERVNCDSSVRQPALIKVSGGEVVIKWLSVEGSSPCEEPLPVLKLLHFTGKDNSDLTCKPDTIKGEVDRVMVDALGDTDVVAVSASPEASKPSWPAGCKETLWGLFRLNRSTIINAGTGLHVWMRAGAQVDVTFNNFADNDKGVELNDAKVEAKISHNNFQNYRFGIFNYNWDTPAPESRVIVLKNVFNNPNYGTGIWLSGPHSDLNGQASQQSRPIIIDNEFELGTGGKGISSTGVSDGIVSGNTFRGTNVIRPAISLSTGALTSNISCGNGGQDVYRWYIGNNDFDEFTVSDGPGIDIGCTYEILIGPEQNTGVETDPFNVFPNIFLGSWWD